MTSRYNDQIRQCGFEWPMPTPPRWEVNRLKWSMKGLVNGTWGDDPNGVEDITCVRVADFDRTRFSVADAPSTLRAVGTSERAGRLLRQGDLLIEKSGGGYNQPVGCVVDFDHEFDAVCSNFIGRISVAPGMWSRYWTYVHATLYSIRLNVPAIKQTTGIQNLDTDAYFNQRVPFPPLTQQRTIADYLDRETARLDALITTKQHMLGLLADKHRALITRAVTRGLDPDAPLRHSSMPWLGEIPAHWTLKRLKFVLAGIDQGSSPQCFSVPSEPGSLGVLKAGCVNDGRFREHENKALPPGVRADLAHLISRGDILMSRASGSAAFVGSVAIVEREPAAKLLLSDKTFRLKFDPAKTSGKYLAFTMGTDLFRHQIMDIISGAEGLPNNIAKSDISALLITVPPFDEQRAIADHLDRTSTAFSTLEKTSCDTISLLKERRSALIAAAVTGRLDVGATS